MSREEFERCAIGYTFAAHYGFTPEETDFIINDDIKDRMGKGGEE